jgi:hypothetical protein
MNTSKTYDRLVELCRIAKVLNPKIRVRNAYGRLVYKVPLGHLQPHEQEQMRELYLQIVDALVRLNHIHRVEIRKNQWEACREDVTNALALMQKDVFPHSLLKDHHRDLLDALREKYGEEGRFRSWHVAQVFRINRRTLHHHLTALVQARCLMIVGGTKHGSGYIYQVRGIDQ